MVDQYKIKEAVKYITHANHAIAFTGAGISVESGIPSFRGEKGLWNKYDPKYLDISYFYSNPIESWEVIKEIFYDFFNSAKPNKAHIGLAKLEEMGFLKSVITQNIDNLHTEAGNKVVYEFHGNSKELVCLTDGEKYSVSDIDFNDMPPRCKKCGEILKPDFIFFGEPIPELAHKKSFQEAEYCDVVIVVGSTGEVFPAASVPKYAKQLGAYIIEINPKKSYFTDSITDLFIQGKASEVFTEIMGKIKEKQ